MIRFILVLLFLICFLIFSIPLAIVLWLIGKKNPALKDRIAQAVIKWAFGCCNFLSGIRVDYIGLEHIPTDRAVLYVGNHQSYFDILLTYGCFPHPTGYVAKAGMSQVPLLAAWMRNIRCLFLDRENIREGMKAILKGIEELKSGISLCIFPEGTRNSDPDELLAFHEGSFRLAEKAKCPIIPISINNSRAIWEAHLPLIKPAHVVIEFGKPIIIEELAKEERKFLGAYVQKEIKHIYDKNKALV